MSGAAVNVDNDDAAELLKQVVLNVGRMGQKKQRRGRRSEEMFLAGIAPAAILGAIGTSGTTRKLFVLVKEIFVITIIINYCRHFKCRKSKS